MGTERTRRTILIFATLALALAGVLRTSLRLPADLSLGAAPEKSPSHRAPPPSRARVPPAALTVRPRSFSLPVPDPAAALLPVSPSNPAYYAHVPKTGGYGAALHLNRLLGRKLGFRCAHGGGRCNRAFDWGAWAAEGEGRGCRIHMSEDCWGGWEEGGGVPGHVYTMVRPPRHHVMSQFFHCAESRAHRGRRTRMPGLDEWLGAWTEAKESTEGNPEAREAAEKGLYRRYACFNPIDKMSAHLEVPPRVTKRELRDRFDVIGILPFFTTSTCMMAIHAAQKVPEACDCSRKEGEDDEKVAFRVDHGVTNHGDSAALTPQQEKMIDSLTDHDRHLYELAEELFYESVEKFNKEYSIQLCMQ